MERLQKVIASSGVASRRKAEEMIKSGRVKVNGKVVLEMGIKVSSMDIVMVDDKTIAKADPLYFVMNKPRYTVTSTNDEHNRDTVISILPKELQESRLFPVGRLDYDTKGVLILTNDGEFMNALVGPKSDLEKEYLARVEGQFTKSDAKIMEQGVDIGDYKTRKCRVEVEQYDREHNSTLVKIILKEGKNHQVKRMFEAMKFSVKRLSRVRFGEITTEGLAEGQVRPLKPHEVKRLYVLSKPQTKI